MTHGTQHDRHRRGIGARLALWGGAAALLATPWVAMQFTSEVNWGAEDFTIIGVMLFVACGAYELAATFRGSLAYRAGAGLAILTAFVLVWMNLAVGLIGNEDNPLNALYGGVLLTAVVGAVIARFRARGMALAMMATAAAQIAVGVVAFVASEASIMSFAQLTVLNTGFAALWLGAAGLFRRAATEG